MLGKFNEALIDFNKALEINPNNTYVLTLSGEIYLKFQLYGKALLCFKIASEFDHSNIKSLVHSNNALQKFINTLLFHGETFYSLKQFDKALLYYDKVLEIDPFNLIALSFCGKVYYSLGQYYKAFLNLNKALDINPLDMATLLYRGEAYFNHGHYDKAFFDLEKVLEQYDYDEDLYNLGMSLEIKSNYTKVLILQAKICFNLEKYSDTIQFLKIEFNNAFILYSTDINFKLRQFNKAISDLDIAIKFKPNDIEMLILRGKSYFFLEKYDLAFFDFIKALELEPDNIFILLYINEIFDKLLLLKNNNSIFIDLDIEMHTYNILLHYQKLDVTLNAYGNYILGLCYYSGIGVKKNERKMFINFYKAATMGFAKGIFKV
ncbi:tetratricopeptide repeat protein [Gigaspora margarita]|uniref:Tetratricopeptide repeat protein n=1 Tax=Gigaspora margarita TaxID=4874 RepID=A0A8H4AY81_GIGMA|nr:tetratricopeptide repeat protein [Gigaspora margarita]